jgi:arsenite-transporting ATPase
VEICSVDPAPSLDDIFGKDVGDRLEPVLGDPKFRASEMDSMSVFKTWVAEVKEKIDQAMSSETSGVHIDLSFERELISALLDSVPPGVDEVLAVFRIIDLLSHRGRVVIDMAPTGHALDLLRMPDRILAWTRVLLKTLAEHRKLNLARDAGVKVAELAHRVRELASLLTDSERARIYTVMLAEPLPDRETERLVTDLRSLNLDSKVIFINRVLFPQDIQRCKRCNRARRWQLATIARLRRRYPDTTLYIVRNFPNEISGKKALGSLTREIWQLA